MPEKSAQSRSHSLSVPWDDVVRFVRQLTHDLRNDLNAIELQSAYIAELEKNEELQSEIKRLREMVSRLTSTLQRLSRDVGEVKPTLISYRATDLMEDLRRKIDDDFPKKNTEITWEIQPGNAMLNVDPQLLQEVITELFANAFLHDRGKGPLLAKAEIDNNLEPAKVAAAQAAWAPVNRVADPREIAQGALFLASDESSFAVGSCLVLDGGFTAK